MEDPPSPIDIDFYTPDINDIKMCAQCVSVCEKLSELQDSLNVTFNTMSTEMSILSQSNLLLTAHTIKCALRAKKKPILIVNPILKLAALKIFDFEVIRTDGTQKFDKCVANIESKFSSIRTSGPNAHILDHISVTCFGNHISLKQIAHISPVSSSEILVEPYDPSTMKEIEVGIQKSALNLSPRVDGKCIRVAIPQLSEDQRKSYTKMAKEISEEGKVAVRNVRRELIEKVKQAEKEKSIGKDTSKSYQEQIQKFSENYITALEKLYRSKEKDLLCI